MRSSTELSLRVQFPRRPRWARSVGIAPRLNREAPPPPVKPAPNLEDVEDLMFVDADIEADRRKPPR